MAVTPQATTVDRVDQQVIFVETARKRALLADLFAEPKFSRVLVFTRTKRGADRVAKSLEPPASRPPPSTATRASPSASAPWRRSRPAPAAPWSPPTSPRAASTWTGSAT